MKSYKERTEAALKKIDEYNTVGELTVENGGQTLSVKRSKPIILWTAFAAACAAVIIAFNLILFLPFPVAAQDISAYKDSEYYGLMSVVNELTTPKPKYKNNFEKLTALFKKAGGNNNNDFENVPPMTPDYGTAAPDGSSSNDASTPDGSSSNNGNYNETTNNQVAGVIEGDLLKRSDKYAFYVAPRHWDHSTWQHIDTELRIYALNGASAPLVASYGIASDGYFVNCEMYLSADCNTVTIILNNYNSTCVINLDVSDVNNVNETARIQVSGRYISSRLKDGNLLLFTNFSVYDSPDFSNQSQFLPQFGTPNNMKSISAENIIYDKTASAARYTVVCAVEQATLNITSQYAFLDFSREVYVSESRIFLTHEYSADYADEVTDYLRNTEINCLSYTDGVLEYVNKAYVHGFVLNQYSMDEYDGNLRIVTEVSSSGYSGASLYCIDLESFEICASLEKFAPDGEKVYSVRFDGATAYVCTAISYQYYFCDPVFAIDLSDLNNITYKDTGTITGYSMSLTKFKDGTLLGIGYGDWLNELKIELYRENGNGVESVACFEKSCEFSSEFKAHFIDAENGLVGLGIYDFDDGESKYLLLHFDGEKIEVTEEITFESNTDYSYIRTAYADGYIYVFTQNGIEVINPNA